jgi:hypothetical protein
VKKLDLVFYMTLTRRDDQTPLSLVCSVITINRLRLGWIERKGWRNSCAEYVISGIKAKLIVRYVLSSPEPSDLDPLSL